MDAFNSLNVLPIYTSVAYQNSNKWYAFGNIWPLVSPTNSLLPFQFVVPYNITSASEVRIKDSNSGETYQSGITPEIDSSMYGSSGYSVVKVKEQTFPSLTLEEGRYYLEISISDGSGTYSFVSDIFTAVSDLSKYIKIEYWNDENLYYKGGEISYTNDFKFIMYVCSSIGKPEYEFEEELTERAGYKFLESQISNKLYKFTFVAPEFICDAMRLIRMSDYIVITSLGKKFNALTFSYEPEWEEQGDLASVEVEFTIDNIIQKLASFNRRQKQDFYNALLANEVEALKFDDESVAQYYKDFQQTYSGTNFIDGKLIRELDELTSLLDSTGYLPIDIGTGAARKIELSIITESIKSSLSEKFLRKDQVDKTNFLVKFLAGLQAGEFEKGVKGVGVYQDDTGNWHIETDYLDVRLKFTATTVEIQKAYHIGGAQIKSAASMKCVRVEELDDVYRCYMNVTDDDGNEVTNDFRVNDQAYVNTFNLVKQADGKTGNHFLWRLVTAVGTDYIDLSKTVCAADSDAPLSGDDIVLLGYQGTDDASRQVAVIDAGAGEGAPYYRQFTGINSFNLPEPETQLKPGNNILTGVIHIQNGSTGAGNIADLPEEVQKAAEFAVKVGGVNLLLNSGFTGNYETEQLEADTMLEEGSEMYSKALLHWSGMATVQEDEEAASGRSAVIGSLSQSVNLIPDETYVISYKAKGEELAVSCGDYNVAQPLTSEYVRYTHRFTFTGTGVFLISGTATVCDLQLERGTIATDWSQSPQDNDKAMAEFLKLKHLSDAIKDGSVDFIGGLQLTNVIQLGNYKDGKMQKVTAGISGIYNDDDDVYTWGGGTLEQAIYTIIKYKENPQYQPSDEELANMAKAVITHGGRAILNDIIVRGYVYAIGGRFLGDIEAKTLQLGITTNKEEETCDGACVYFSNLGLLPELQEGRCREIKLIVPLVTRLLVTYRFKGENDNVKIAINGNYLDRGTEFTASGSGGSAFLLMGTTYNNETIWSVFSLNDTAKEILNTMLPE